MTLDKYTGEFPVQVKGTQSGVIVMMENEDTGTVLMKGTHDYPVGKRSDDWNSRKLEVLE